MKKMIDFFYWLKRKCRDISFSRSARYFWQRRIRGWDDSETWHIPYTTAKLLLPRMKRFKQLRFGHPMGMTEKEWDDILDKIILAFEICVKTEAACDYGGDEQEKQYEEGIALFHEYYETIWW